MICKKSYSMMAFISLIVAVAPISAATAKPYPKVDPEKIFPELKVYDEQGRPYRAAREDWDGARKRVESDPRWKKWLSEEQEAVEAWMARHRDRVTWVAGWSNDFVSPKDGSKLTWTEKIPDEEVDHFSSPSDARVEITDKLMAAWVRIWREHHAQMMERAAQLYRLTGDERYARWSAEQLDFYVTHYLEWEPQRQGARLFWQCLTEGVNLITYAHTVRLLGDYVDPARRQWWHDDFFVPEVLVLNKNFPKILNITCWLRSAAAQVALVFDDEPMWEEATDGAFGVRQQVSEGITSDYLWFEQSLGYNNYVVSALASLFETAGLYGRTGDLLLEMATVENLMLAGTYLRFPDGRLPTPSDTKGQLMAPDREFFGSHYRVFPTTLGLKEAQGVFSWATLLDPPQPLEKTVQLPEVKSRNLESSRMAILKEGPWQVFFHYGQPSVKSHLQAEVLNFSATYGDVDVTHDPGTVGYGSPLHKYYYTRGLNHNVPTINGEAQEQPPKGRRPDPFAETRAGELTSFSTNPPIVSAFHSVYRSDACARRELSIHDETLIDVAEVASQASGPQKLGLVLHVQGHVMLPAGFTVDPDFADGRPPAFGYWDDVRVAEFENAASFEVDYGSVMMKVTFDVILSNMPAKFRLWHGSTPDTPPGRREGFYLEVLGKSATFTTMFHPLDAHPEPLRSE